jgi:hypothetical protein
LLSLLSKRSFFIFLYFSLFFFFLPQSYPNHIPPFSSNQRSEPLGEQEAIADVWMFCLAGEDKQAVVVVVVFDKTQLGMETSAHTLGWLMMRLAFNQVL